MRRSHPPPLFQSQKARIRRVAHILKQPLRGTMRTPSLMLMAALLLLARPDGYAAAYKMNPGRKALNPNKVRGRRFEESGTPTHFMQPQPARTFPTLALKQANFGRVEKPSKKKVRGFAALLAHPLEHIFNPLIPPLLCAVTTRLSLASLSSYTTSICIRRLATTWITQRQRRVILARARAPRSPSNLTQPWS